MDESETVSVPHDERRRSFAYQDKFVTVPLDGRNQTSPKSTQLYGKEVEREEKGFIKEGDANNDVNKEGDFRGDGEEAGEEEGDTIDFIPKKIVGKSCGSLP
jgi:hypothetical protein